MRRRSRGCIRREDTMNVGMILPFSKNAYVGNFRHAPLVPSAASHQLTKAATDALPHSLLNPSLRNNPLVGALSHAPHSQGLKALIEGASKSQERSSGAAAAAPLGLSGHVVTSVGVALARPLSPVSTSSSGGRSSPLSCGSADHEYGGISNWASRMGAVLDTHEDHLESWSVAPSGCDPIDL